MLKDTRALVARALQEGKTADQIKQSSLLEQYAGYSKRLHQSRSLGGHLLSDISTSLASGAASIRPCTPGVLDI